MYYFNDVELFGIESVVDSSLPIRNMTRVLVFDSEKRIGLVENKWYPHWFDLPGGGCEEGESFDACAVRECLEELGAEVDSLRQIAVYDRSDKGQGKHFHIMFYYAKVIRKGTPTTTDIREQNRAVIWLPIAECIDLMSTYLSQADSLDIKRSPKTLLHILEIRALEDCKLTSNLC